MPSSENPIRDEAIRVEFLSNSHHPGDAFVDHRYEVVDEDGCTVTEGLWSHPVRSRERGREEARDEASTRGLVRALVDSLELFEQGVVYHFRCLGGEYRADLVFESCELHCEIRCERTERVEKGVDL